MIFIKDYILFLVMGMFVLFFCIIILIILFVNIYGFIIMMNINVKIKLIKDVIFIVEEFEV